METYIKVSAMWTTEKSVYHRRNWRENRYWLAPAKSLQSCLTPCDPIDGSPPSSPVPGIHQARTLEWVAISFSNAWKWKVKVKSLSSVWILATPWTAAYQDPPSMRFSRQEYWSGGAIAFSVYWLKGKPNRNFPRMPSFGPRLSEPAS